MPDEPLVPPRYANVPVSVLFDRSLAEGLRDTYAQMRALAWRSGGKETPLLNVQTLVDITGKKQSTVYKHLAALDLHGVLRLRRANSRTFSICFVDPEVSTPVEVSTSVERLIKESLKESPEMESTSDSIKKRPKTRDSTPVELSTSVESLAGAGTRAIQDAYVAELGYPVDDWGAGEAVAARKIGQAYSVAEFVEAYRHYKAQPFWDDKRLKLRHLASQLPEYFASKKREGRNGSNGPKRNDAPGRGEPPPLSEAQRIARRFSGGGAVGGDHGGPR